MTKKPRLHAQEVPAYLDREVSTNDRDRFGHTHLAAALRGLIEDDRHRPPYSIGLLGKWGTGKSTVKGLYLQHLRNDERQAKDRVKRRDRIYPITFNAWKYGGEADIRKSLFRHLYIEIGGTHEEADRNLFKTVASIEAKRKSFRELVGELVDHCALVLAMVGMFALLFLLLVAALSCWIAGTEDPLAYAATVFGPTAVVAILAQRFFKTLPALSARTPVNITSAPSQTIEEFEDLFLGQIRKFKRGRALSGRGKKVQRMRP